MLWAWRRQNQDFARRILGDGLPVYWLLGGGSPSRLGISIPGRGPPASLTGPKDLVKDRLVSEGEIICMHIQHFQTTNQPNVLRHRKGGLEDYLTPCTTNSPTDPPPFLPPPLDPTGHPAMHHAFAQGQAPQAH